MTVRDLTFPGLVSDRFGVPPPILARGDAETPSKRPVKVRQIIEATLEGCGGDRILRSGEQGASPLQSQLAYVSAQRHPNPPVERARETKAIHPDCFSEFRETRNFLDVVVEKAPNHPGDRFDGWTQASAALRDLAQDSGLPPSSRLAGQAARLVFYSSAVSCWLVRY